MVTRRAVISLLLVQLFAFALVAQQSAEFGRAAGGEVKLTPKNAARFSGSLELSMSRGGDVFGGGSSPSYGGTVGGTLLEDRLWFFASASREQGSRSRFGQIALPENAATSAVGARVNGQIGDSHDFSSFFEAARRPELSATTPLSFGGIAPSNFLSMRYTGVISSNMIFSASFTRSSRGAQSAGTLPVE